MFSVYTSNDLIGSPKVMFDLLKKASVLRPVDGNQDGSYLTLKSNYGLIFGVIQLCSGMGTVFLDQGYWQRAIASRPTTAVRAYIMGGMAWFAIPFGFATTLGLSAVALTDNPAYPTYPNNMTSSQISSGLSAPFASVALLGKPGAVALLLTLFMAVTSSSSSELIAVSSILTFDVYKMYFNPDATSDKLIQVSHIMICVFGVTMAIFACIWNAIGIDLGWLFLVMGLLSTYPETNSSFFSLYHFLKRLLTRMLTVGGAVFPAAFAVTWRKQSKYGAMAGALGGLSAGLIAWLVQAQHQYGELSVKTTGSSYPTLAGNMAGVLSGLILTIVVSYIKPDNFDWDITRGINRASISVSANYAPDSDPSSTNPTSPNNEKSPEKSPVHPETAREHHDRLPTILDEEKEAMEDAAILEDPTRLAGALRFAYISSITLTLIMMLIIPIPMFLSHYIFSLGFFKVWVAISFIWVFYALTSCAILPIYEALGFFRDFFKETKLEFKNRGGRSST